MLDRQMESFVLFQSATPAECLAIFRTGKWLLYCVNPFMIFKSQLSVNDWSHLEQVRGERLGKSGIPVSRELKYLGKLTPLFANNAQNIKPFTFHASGLFFKVEFLLDTQPFIFLENNLTTDGASV